jgi:hypothetical protein
MTPQRSRRILVVGLVTLGVTLAASVFGLHAEQFLVGVFGGGALTGAYLAVRGQTRQTG